MPDACRTVAAGGPSSKRASLASEASAHADPDLDADPLEVEGRDSTKHVLDSLWHMWPRYKESNLVCRCTDNVHAAVAQQNQQLNTAPQSAGNGSSPPGKVKQHLGRNSAATTKAYMIVYVSVYVSVCAGVIPTCNDCDPCAAWTGAGD